MCYTDGATVMLHSIHKKHKIADLKVHYKCVNDFAFLNGQHEIISMGEDGFVVKWSPEFNTETEVLHNDNWSDSD